MSLEEYFEKTKDQVIDVTDEPADDKVFVSFDGNTYWYKYEDLEFYNNWQRGLTR